MELSQQHACHECDLLMALPEKLLPKQALVCPRCKSVQYTHYPNALEHALSFSISAIILLIIASMFPFLSFDSQGYIHTINLLQTPYELYQQGFVLLSFLVFAFVVLLPFLYLACVLALLLPIRLQKVPLAPVQLGKAISYFLPWSMAEVFIVGVLVALIKASEAADIIFEGAFWAYLAFVVFFVATANVLSKQQLWAWIDNAKPR